MARQLTRYFGDDEDEDAGSVYQQLLSGGGSGSDYSLPDPDDTARATTNDASQVLPDPDERSSPSSSPEESGLSLTAPDASAPRRVIAKDDTVIEPESGGGGGGGDSWPMWRDIDMGLAMLLDLGANQGRGLGQMLGAYTNNRDAEQRAQAAHKQRLAEIQARQQQGGDFSDYVKLRQLWQSDERLRQATDRLGQAAEGRQLSRERFDETRRRHGQEEDINSDLSQTKVALREQGAQAATRGSMNERHNRVDETAADQAQIAGAKAAASEISRNQAQATTPRPVTPDQNLDNIRADRQQQLAETHQAFMRDERKRIDSDRRREQFLRDTESLRDIYGTAQKLQAIFDRHPDGLPGVGPVDSSALKEWVGAASQDDIDVRNLLASLANYRIKQITGASVGGPSEQERLKAMLPAKGMLEGSTRTAVANTLDYVLHKLRAAGAGRDAEAREVLAHNGFDPDAILGKATPPANAPEILELQTPRPSPLGPASRGLGANAPLQDPSASPFMQRFDAWKKKGQR